MKLTLIDAPRQHFTIVPNDLIRDRQMKALDLVLLITIMSHSAGYDLSTRALYEGAPEGRDAVQAALKRLVDARYIHRVQIRNGETKQFGKQVLIRSWTPLDEADIEAALASLEVEFVAPKPEPENPEPAFPDTANPDPGKSDPKEYKDIKENKTSTATACEVQPEPAGLSTIKALIEGPEPWDLFATKVLELYGHTPAFGSVATLAMKWAACNRTKAEFVDKVAAIAADDRYNARSIVSILIQDANEPPPEAAKSTTRAPSSKPKPWLTVGGQSYDASNEGRSEPIPAARSELNTHQRVFYELAAKFIDPPLAEELAKLRPAERSGKLNAADPVLSDWLSKFESDWWPNGPEVNSET